MNYVYQSNFKQYIEGLIEQKHALGFPYCRSVDYLRRFDQLCLNEFPNETVLTKEIGQKWGMIRDTEKRVSFQDRMAPIRELAKYMLRLGIDAYIGGILCYETLFTTFQPLKAHLHGVNRLLTAVILWINGICRRNDV